MIHDIYNAWNILDILNVLLHWQITDVMGDQFAASSSSPGKLHAKKVGRTMTMSKHSSLSFEILFIRKFLKIFWTPLCRKWYLQFF